MRRLGENGWEALSLAGLLSLLVIDYILSYIGITLGVAYELIPWSRWLSHLPFLAGLLVRGLFAWTILELLVRARSAHPHRYPNLVLVLYVLQVIPMTLHIYWITVTL